MDGSKFTPKVAVVSSITGRETVSVAGKPSVDVYPASRAREVVKNPDSLCPGAPALLRTPVARSTVNGAEAGAVAGGGLRLTRVDSYTASIG